MKSKIGNSFGTHVIFKKKNASIVRGDKKNKELNERNEMIINLIINTIYFYQSKKSTLISNRRRQW